MLIELVYCTGVFLVLYPFISDVRPHNHVIMMNFARTFLTNELDVPGLALIMRLGRVMSKKVPVTLAMDSTVVYWQARVSV